MNLLDVLSRRSGFNRATKAPTSPRGSDATAKSFRDSSLASKRNPFGTKKWRTIESFHPFLDARITPRKKTRRTRGIPLRRHAVYVHAAGVPGPLDDHKHRTTSGTEKINAEKKPGGLAGATVAEEQTVATTYALKGVKKGGSRSRSPCTLNERVFVKRVLARNGYLLFADCKAEERKRNAIKFDRQQTIERVHCERLIERFDRRVSPLTGPVIETISPMSEKPSMKRKESSNFPTCR